MSFVKPAFRETWKNTSGKLLNFGFRSRADVDFCRFFLCGLWPNSSALLSNLMRSSAVGNYPTNRCSSNSSSAVEPTARDTFPRSSGSSKLRHPAATVPNLGPISCKQLLNNDNYHLYSCPEYQFFLPNSATFLERRRCQASR